MQGKKHFTTVLPSHLNNFIISTNVIMMYFIVNITVVELNLFMFLATNNKIRVGAKGEHPFNINGHDWSRTCCFVKGGSIPEGDGRLSHSAGVPEPVHVLGHPEQDPGYCQGKPRKDSRLWGLAIWRGQPHSAHVRDDDVPDSQWEAHVGQGLSNFSLTVGSEII